MHEGAVLIETFGKGWVLPVCVYTLDLCGVHYFPVVETPIVYGANRAVEDDYTVDRTILEMIIKSAIQLVGQEAS